MEFELNFFNAFYSWDSLHTPHKGFHVTLWLLNNEVFFFVLLKVFCALKPMLFKVGCESNFLSML